MSAPMRPGAYFSFTGRLGTVYFDCVMCGTRVEADPGSLCHGWLMCPPDALAMAGTRATWDACVSWSMGR